jgi:hypothetical protein
MRILVVLLLSMISYSSYAQFFGYQGKRLEITLGISAMPNPAIINPMRYGENNDTPSGFALPISPSVEFNFAVSRHIGIGFKTWYASNFVGYRVAGVNGGFYTGNNLPSELRLNATTYNFDKNHTVKTFYTGVVLRYYTRSFIAPAGNYFEFGYGKVNVMEDDSDVYETSSNTITYSKNGVAFTPVASPYVEKEIKRPKIDPVGLLSFGYYVRKETKLINNLMYDVGATFSFGMGSKPGSVENVGAFSNQYNVEVSSEDELDELIKGTTYVFIRKQIFFRFSAKLIYLF